MRFWVLFLVLVSPAIVFSQYPSRPVKLVIGFSPGGAADFVARALQEPLARGLGQPVIVENKPGAGSSIAAEQVAKSTPDGYTFLIASPSSILVNPIIAPRPGFEPLRDLVPVSKVSSSPLVIAVHASVGVATLRELIAYAKKNPGKLNYASSGSGAAPHLAAVLFMRLAGVEMVHVPYKGGGPAVQSLLAGDTQLSFATPPSVLPHVKSEKNPGGRLHALAITARERSPLVPGVPGMVEAGLPDYEISFWYGIFVPAATPKEVVRKLFEATGAALKHPSVAPLFAKEGTEAVGSRSPEDFGAFIGEDGKLWSKLVKDAGVKAE